MFLTYVGLLTEKEEVNKLKKHWINRMDVLRRKWSKLNRSKKLDQTKEAFLSYQKEVLYEPTVIPSAAGYYFVTSNG